MGSVKNAHQILFIGPNDVYMFLTERRYPDNVVESEMVQISQTMWIFYFVPYNELF